MKMLELKKKSESETTEKTKVDENNLPLPNTTPQPNGPKQATISKSKPTVLASAGKAWNRFVQRIHTASSPSDNSVTGGGTSSHGPRSIAEAYVRNANAKVNSKISKKKSRSRGGRSRHTSRGQNTTQADDDSDREVDEGRYTKIDKVVVDGGLNGTEEWGRKLAGGPLTQGSLTANHEGGTTNGGKASHSHSNYDEDDDINSAGCWGESKLLTWVRWRVAPVIVHFFDLSFMDPDEEELFQKDSWFQAKTQGYIGAGFLVFIWVITLCFAAKPFDIVNKLAYWVIAPIFVVPLALLIVYDLPRRKPFLYQIYLFCATWLWSIMALADLAFCHYYAPSPYNKCGGKDFTGAMFSAVGIPAITMFACKASRVSYFVGALAFLLEVCVLAAPHSSTWIRNAINFALFTAFILGLSYMKEKADRRLFSLRDQLKRQFRATQKAQVAENKATNSKNRFVSYIFHEIRVPLNTASLALQNLQSADVFQAAEAEGNGPEVDALFGSISMVHQVLNDVLDISKMDAGKFETVSSPFPFHRVLKSMLGSIQVGAQSKGIDFGTDFDDRIDEICANSVEGSDLEPVVFGDEMRLRQVISNLASNAVKFTGPGGRIRLTTRLVFPVGSPAPARASDKETELAAEVRTVDRSVSLSSKLEKKMMDDHPVERIAVRIEVSDTGLGINSSDMIENRLFSPYVQTEIGRLQGGKGTGLGLALVSNIIKLSRGRLGVISQKGVGSTFWIELPFELTSAAKRPKARSPRAGKESLMVHQPSSMIDHEPESPPAPDSIREGSDGGKVSDHSDIPLERPPVIGNPRNNSMVSTSSRAPLLPHTLTSGSLGTSPPLPEEHQLPQVIQSSSALGSRSVFSTSPLDGSYLLNPPELSPPAMTNGKQLRSLSNTSTAATAVLITPPLSVLVVDDNDSNRLMLSRMITRMGHTVGTAEDGQQALDILLAAPPNTYDVVFLDNSMPKMTGLEVISEIRQLGRDDFVCGATGNASKDDQDEYRAAGVNDLIAKPIMKPRVIDVLQEAHRRRLLRRDAASTSA